MCFFSLSGVCTPLDKLESFPKKKNSPSSVECFQEESDLILCQGVYGHSGLCVPYVSKQVP